MEGLFGDGLVDGVLFCGGDSLEEDLRCGPRLGFFVDLVEFEDGVTDRGAALFKTVKAFSRGAFFFSTSVELKTKGAGGGGAGREMMDSNTSLPAILTPKHFLAVSAICFDRLDFACTCFSGKSLPGELTTTFIASLEVPKIELLYKENDATKFTVNN